MNQYVFIVTPQKNQKKRCHPELVDQARLDPCFDAYQRYLSKCLYTWVRGVPLVVGVKGSAQ